MAMKEKEGASRQIMLEKEGKSRQIMLTFLQPGTEDGTARRDNGTDPRMSYRDQQAAIRQRANQHHVFTQGSLLDTLEKGVVYPVVHVDWAPDDQAAVTCSNRDPKDFGEGLSVQQGLYSEVKRIEPDIAFSPRDQPKCYILLGFRSLESRKSPVLESTWRDWTGARQIYLNLHHSFDLVRIVFYHRDSPRHNLEVFMYLVLVEVANVTQQNIIQLLDFVQRTRVEKLNGYISLYRDLGTSNNCCPSPVSEDCYKDPFSLGNSPSPVYSRPLLKPTINNPQKSTKHCPEKSNNFNLDNSAKIGHEKSTKFNSETSTKFNSEITAELNVQKSAKCNSEKSSHTWKLEEPRIQKENSSSNVLAGLDSLVLHQTSSVVLQSPDLQKSSSVVLQSPVLQKSSSLVLQHRDEVTNGSSTQHLQSKHYSIK